MTQNADAKRFVSAWIDEKQELFSSYADAVWEYAELGCEEYNSSRLLCSVLRDNGFEVEEGVAGMPTAFIARWGTGGPSIGFNCEFDALPGLSQCPIALTEDPRKEPLVQGAPGHGCGHCILGTGSVFAAIATKIWLEREGIPGTLTVFGTPAEELCVGKPYMAREGLYEGYDAILDWHPWGHNNAGYDRMNAYFNIKYSFHGVTAHGNAPWMGKSALDGAVLMAHAIEMLREHMPPGETSLTNTAGANTVNYTFSDTGPEYPNVVPDRATLWVVGRFCNSDQMRGVIERIHRCAEGAAMATGTTSSMEFITATHEKIPNRTLAKVLYDNWQAIGTPGFDEAEQEFVRKLQGQMGVEPTGNTPGILPFTEGNCVVCDTPEYSWFAPFSTIWVNMLQGGFGWHNWQVAATARSTVGKKTMVNAAKVLAASCIDLLTDPGILPEARSELKERLAGRTYSTLIPDGVKPPLGINRDTMEKYRPLLDKACAQDDGTAILSNDDKGEQK
ncbi:MAG TPA: amidohydrolase [Deltaproteobacteria bacterium]|nr:amidohydrolase [Deltaproteobacteria bacterium]